MSLFNLLPDRQTKPSSNMKTHILQYRKDKEYSLERETGSRIPHPITQTSKDSKRTDSILNITELTQNLIHNINKTDPDIELKYYNLSRPRTDHCPCEFLVGDPNICKSPAPSLLILVVSAPQNFQARMSIRETWGKYANGLSLSPPHDSFTVSLAFLLGKRRDTWTDYTPRSESERFHDIIIGKFEDTYENLTRKTLMGLKWMTSYCAAAKYVLKIDDDIFVHIPNLVEMLKTIPANLTGGIYGHLHSGSQTQRQGMWAVTHDQYPLSKYPPYMSGASYVISGNIVRKLLLVSQYMPFLPIEDVFITGVLPHIIGAPCVSRKGFTCWTEHRPNPCQFIKEKKISAHRIRPIFMKVMWQTQLKYPQSCLQKGKRRVR